MLIKLICWINGYLLIKMKGQSPERFINLCSNRYIYLWNLQNVEGDYEFNITVKDYRKLKSIARKTRNIPYIKKRYGLPFFVHRYKGRKGFFGGILIFCIIIYMLSLHIWDINIQGGHSYTSEAMVKFLRSNQIYAGLQKKNIDCQDIEDLIRGTYKDIGWVSAEMKGTRLIIKITETNLPAPAVTATENCHIIASKDCIITKIITRTGTPLVGIGSVVKKGDILVSGVLDIVGDFDELVSKTPVIADADIIGKSYYEYTDTFPLNYIEKKYTGNTKVGYHFSFLLKKINLYNPRILYTKYDIIVKEFKLHLSDNFYLPLGYSVAHYPEYSEMKKKYTEIEATELAKDKLKRYLDDLVENKVLITGNDIKIEIEKNTCTTKGKIFVLESVKEFKTLEDSDWIIINTEDVPENNN